MKIIVGVITSGVLRGGPLIDKYFHRLSGILGTEPFRGTLNIKLENKIDLKSYSTKALDHVLIDGRKHVDMWIAPISITVNNERYECWAMQQSNSIYDKKTIEIIAKDNMRAKFGLKDGEELCIELLHKKPLKQRFYAKMFPKSKRYVEEW